MMNDLLISFNFHDNCIVHMLLLVVENYRILGFKSSSVSGHLELFMLVVMSSNFSCVLILSESNVEDKGHWIYFYCLLKTKPQFCKICM